MKDEEAHEELLKMMWHWRKYEWWWGTGGIIKEYEVWREIKHFEELEHRRRNQKTQEERRWRTGGKMQNEESFKIEKNKVFLTW